MCQDPPADVPHARASTRGVRHRVLASVVMEGSRWRPTISSGRASRALVRLVSGDRHAYRGHVLGTLAALLLQAPLVPGLVEVEPLRPRWNHLVLSFASAPATASGAPGTASARLQLRLPGTGARLGLEQGLVGAYQSTAAPRQPGSLQSMRGAARAVFSMPF